MLLLRQRREEELIALHRPTSAIQIPPMPGTAAFLEPGWDVIQIPDEPAQRERDGEICGFEIAAVTALALIGMVTR